jgi:hypothetical protein
MRFYWLVLGVLAVWRVTHLLAAEDGPWNLVVWMRRKAGGGFLGRLLDCFYCLSLWIAAPLAFLIGETYKERLFLWPALSAGAIFLNKLGSDGAVPPAYYEEGVQDDAMLRERTSASTESELNSSN